MAWLVEEEFDDAKQVSTDIKYRCLAGIIYDAGIIRASYNRLDPREVVANWMTRASHWNDERLATVSSLVSTLPMTEDYYATYQRLDYPFWDRPIGMRRDVLDLIDEFCDDEMQRICPVDTYPPDNRNSASTQCQSAVQLDYQLRIPEDETLWSWSYIGNDGLSIIRFDRAWTSSGGLYRSLDLYDIYIPAANMAAFERAMGIVRRPGIADYNMRCSSEKMAVEE